LTKIGHWLLAAWYSILCFLAGADDHNCFGLQGPIKLG